MKCVSSRKSKIGISGQTMVESALLTIWVLILILGMIEIFSLVVNVFIAMDVSHTSLRKAMVGDMEAAKNSILIYPIISFFSTPGKVNIIEDSQRKIVTVENEYIHLGIVSFSYAKRLKIINRTVKSPEEEFYGRSYPQAK